MLHRTLLLLFLFSFGSFAPTALAGLFVDAPDVLVCSVDDPTDVLPWDELVFYLSARIEMATRSISR